MLTKIVDSIAMLAAGLFIIAGSAALVYLALNNSEPGKRFLVSKKSDIELLPVENLGQDVANLTRALTQPEKERNLPQENSVSLSGPAAAVYNQAKQIIASQNLNVDPLMITFMAKIESNYNPNAKRVEPHLTGNKYQLVTPDTSYGYMQVLTSTANWLYKSQGYTAYGAPTVEKLLNPTINIYFGAAYVDYLNNRFPFASPEEIVEYYNGGPGNSNSMTRRHLSRYKAAKEQYTS